MRKRSKYRPRAVINTVAYVMDGVKPVRQHPAYTNLLIRNHGAAAAMARGQATRADMDDLIQLNNMVHAMLSLGFGAEYKEVADAGKCALLAVCRRGLERGRFVATGKELQAINALMELHDAQLDVITVHDMEKAMDRVLKTINGKKATVIKEKGVKDADTNPRTLADRKESGGQEACQKAGHACASAS